jgi:hypothetical protein
VLLMTVYPSSNDNPALAQAIADARGGRRDDAVRRLRQIVQADPANVDAWIWLGGTAPDVGEQRRALERALELAPDNPRAQQGLQWLRATAPDAFTAPAPAAPAPDQRWSSTQGTTPHYNTINDIAQRAEAPTQAVDRSRVWEQPQAQPSQPAPYEQPTVQMPVQSAAVSTPSYQQRVPEVALGQRSQPVVQPRPAPPLPRTEMMRGAPPQARARRERHIGANFARGLLAAIWAFGLGAALIITAIMVLALISDPQSIDSVVGSVLRPLGYGVELGTEGRIGILVGAIVLVLLDLAVVAGLMTSRLWSWRIAITVATLTFLGAAVLALLPFVVPIPGFTYSLNNLATQTLLGLLLFTFVLLILTLLSRNAFRRNNRYEAYGR